MDKIRVLLVEDDPDWRKIIATLLAREEDIILVGLATTKEETLTLAKAIDVDVFLVDINLTFNNLDGIYIALNLKQNYNSKIIMLTSMSDEAAIQKSFAAGAVNYILKKNVTDIPEIIRATCNETNPIETLTKDYRRLKKEEQLKVLTPAEREIYDLVEQGYTRNEIEKTLVKTDNTLSTQIKSILKKLGASNLKAAIDKVKSKGII